MKDNIRGGKELNTKRILKRYYKAIILLGMYCFLSGIVLGATPKSIKIGLESVYKDVSNIYIASEQALQIGYFKDGFFQQEASLHTSNVTITRPIGNYYTTGEVYNSFEAAKLAAQHYFGAVPVYIQPYTYSVYLQEQQGNLLPVASSDTRIAFYNGNNELIMISENNIEPLLLQGFQSGYSFGLTQVGNNRKYRGAIGVVKGQNGGLTAYNVVDLEEYLYGVVPAEMPASWPLEALKTQAVAARSIAVFQYNRFISRGYDLVDTTLSQVYRGFSIECESTNLAVDMTRGELIKYKGQVAEALYSSTSGGVTEDAQYVWGNAVPYLQSVLDVFENEPAQKPWVRTITLDEIGSVLIQQGIDIGNVQGVEITSRTPAGRVQVLSIIGSRGTHVIRNENVRTFFGGTKEGSLKSRLFSFYGFIGTSSTSSPAEKLSVMSAENFIEQNLTALSVISSQGIENIPQNVVVYSAQGERNLSNNQGKTANITQQELILGDITVYGQGYGHGLGMSQSGAMGMAKAGYSYINILQHYYTGVTVER